MVNQQADHIIVVIQNCMENLQETVLNKYAQSKT